MSIIKNKKLKAVAFALALIMLLHAGYSAVVTTASDTLDTNDFGYQAIAEQLNTPTLGASINPLGLSMSPFAMGDAALNLSASNAKLIEGKTNEYSYQSYLDFGETVFNILQANVVVVLDKTVTSGGKVEIDFASELGYDTVGDGSGRSEFFTLDMPTSNPFHPTSIFESISQDSVTGKITVKIKDGAEKGRTGSLNLNFNFNPDYAAAVPPEKLMATVSAKVFANGEAATDKKEIKIFSEKDDSFKVLYSSVYPGDGTSANPAFLSSGEVVKRAITITRNKGYYQNKLDPNFRTTLSIYAPIGSALPYVQSNAIGVDNGNITLNATDAAKIGIPAGTYQLLQFSYGNSDWEVGIGESYYNVKANTFYNISLPNTVGIKPVYQSVSYKYLGDDEPSYYEPMKSYYTFDTSANNFSINLDPAHRALHNKTNLFSGIENGDHSLNPMGVGDVKFDEIRTIRNQGNVNVTDTELIFYQSGDGPERANFYDFTIYHGVKSSSFAMQNFEYYFTIANEDGSKEIFPPGGSGFIVDASKNATSNSDYVDPTTPTIKNTSRYLAINIPLNKSSSFPDGNMPKLKPGQYIESLHVIPYGKVDNVLTRGVLAPGYFVAISYTLAAWNNKTWPDGSTVPNGTSEVPLYWQLKYKDDSNGGTGNVETFQGKEYLGQYIGKVPNPEIKGVDAGEALTGLTPGDTVKYRINIFNYAYNAQDVWKNPAIIMRLPVGMELNTTSPFKLIEDSTDKGAVDVAYLGEINGQNVYKLSAPANYNAPTTSAAGQVSFYIDTKINILPQALEGSKAPEFVLTSRDSQSFGTALTNLPVNTLPAGQTKEDYGLADGENFSYPMSQATSSKISVSSLSDVTASSSIKSIKTGDFSTNPVVPADFGETVEVKLTIKNSGNMKLGGFKLYDIVPYPGLNGSSAQCSIKLNSIDAPGSPAIYYYTGSATSAPQISQIDTIDLTGPSWSDSSSVPAKDAKAFYIDFGNYTIEPNKEFSVILKFDIPAESDGEQIAMNQFSYIWGTVNQYGELTSSNKNDSTVQGFSTTTYALTYTKNHGEDVVDNWPQSVNGVITGSNTVAIATISPVRPGYTFKGWFESATPDAGDFNWKGQSITFNPLNKTLTLYDAWTVDQTKTITVTYDMKGGKIGGSAVNPTETKYAEQKLTLPIDVKKSGYEFKGWYRDLNDIDNSRWDESTDIIKSGDIRNNGLTLYAYWVVDSSQKTKVTFKNQNPTIDAQVKTGTMPAEQNKTIGEKIEKPANPVRPGYKLLGWKYNGTMWDFDTEINDTHFDELDLISDWAIDTDVTINASFDIDGGNINGSTTLPSQNDLNVEDTITLPTSNPQKTGYIFVGWFDSADLNGPAWTNTTPITPDHIEAGQVTIVAKWAVNDNETLVVKYVDNPSISDGYHVVMPSPEIRKAEQKVTKPANPVRPGYSFNGWKNGSAYWNFDTDKITSQNFSGTTPNYELVLVADWSINNGANGRPNSTIPVTLDLNGGKISGNSNNIVKNLHVEDIVSPLPTPTKAGYTFVGWVENYNNPTNEKPWTSTCKVTSSHFENGSLVIVAKWNIDTTSKIDVTFSLNGGNIAGNTNNIVITGKNAEASVALPAQPSREGHTFIGWFEDIGTSNEAAWLATSTITTKHMEAGRLLITAKWQVIPYKLAFDANGGTPQSAERTLDYGTKTSLPSVTKPDHVLKGWYNSGGTKVGNAGDSYTIKAGDETLKAEWSLIVYTLHYDTDVVVDVNDKYPPKNNQLTLDQFIAAANIRTTSSIAVAAARSLSFASQIEGSPKITSPDYANLNYNVTTPNFDQKVTLNFEWTAGQKETAVINVKVADRMEPTISVDSSRRVDLYVGDLMNPAPKTENELISLLLNNGLIVKDNYDDAPKIELKYRDGDFSTINWKKSNEVGAFVKATDANGNTTNLEKALVISVISLDGSGGSNGGNSGGSKDKPDSPSTLNPGGNGSGGSTGGSGNGSGNGNIPGTGGGSGGSSGNNTGKLPNGSYIDKNGNLMDSDGNKLASSKEIPAGSYINSNGQLVDSKGNVIDLNGKASGLLPRTGSTLMVLVPLAFLTSVLAVIVAVIKKRVNKR